ncbi:MAG: hypothetical protein HOD72_13055 [Opitutae bacterium]|jgi:hypothetical protein|nr:hypothetical protein [Opitutae bacterium]MBT4225381.1 hypothetical protein [Opitutae bacterium]MBT5378677.1 hypothetical protein [Opitutae bacterium]MBT5691939.1 hypothetical protein [Opitutae bacterium]MBT6461382.1 hypothetical protein [Opitutae bacterium]
MRPIYIFFFIILGSSIKADESPKIPTQLKGEIKKIAPGILELGGIQLDTKQYEIHFPAKINQRQNLIEYAIVHKDGKTHESLLQTEISPYQLQILLLLAKAQKFKEALPEFDAEGHETPPLTPRPKHRIRIFVQDLREKENLSVPLGDWIINVDNGNPMQAEPWMYTGSRLYEGRFLAEEDGDIVAVYLNPVALFNSWIPGNNNDESWIPNPQKVPPVDTPVKVTLKFPK